MHNDGKRKTRTVLKYESKSDWGLGDLLEAVGFGFEFVHSIDR